MDEALTDYLTRLNDGAYMQKQKSFKQIAAWIEKNL